MAVKELLARVQHKRDTSANWEAEDPVLLNGEIIVVDTEDGKMRTKTGDGQKKYSELPFDDEDLRKAIAQKNGAGVAYECTLTASAWEDGKQVLSIPGVTDDTNGTIGLSHDITKDQMEAAKNAEMYVCEQSNGSVTVAIFGDAPQIDIPVVAILMS